MIKKNINIDYVGSLAPNSINFIFYSGPVRTLYLSILLNLLLINYLLYNL